MSKPMVLLASVFFVSACSAPPHPPQEALEGRWEGVAELPDGKTKAIVDFTQDANGSVSAVISVPDERLLSKPLTKVRYDPPRVHFELHAPERTVLFDGSRDGDVLSCTIRSGDMSAAVSLRHTGAVPSPPYTQEDVRFSNGDVTLAGTLLRPPWQGRHPAVVLIHGSSTPSRDDFRFYGDLFARRGIAALIYDMRRAPTPDSRRRAGGHGVSRYALFGGAFHVLLILAIRRVFVVPRRRKAETI